MVVQHLLARSTPLAVRAVWWPCLDYVALTLSPKAMRLWRRRRLPKLYIQVRRVTSRVAILTTQNPKPYLYH